MNEDYARILIEQAIRMMCPPENGGSAPDGAKEDREAALAFVQFMDEMPGGVLIYWAGGGEGIIYANRALLRIFGCGSKEEFMACTGGTFRGLVHPEDLDAVEESIAAQIASSQHDLDYVEYRIRRKDGAIRWIEDYGHFVHINGVGDVFYVFLGDATEKRERERAERARLLDAQIEREKRIKRLIEEYDQERSLVNQKYLRQLQMIEGLSVNYESICYLDLDGDRVVPYRLSSRNEGMFSGEGPYSYTQYIRQYINQWVHPEDREMIERISAPDHIRKTLEKNPTYYVNYRILADGECLHLQLRLVNMSRREDVLEVVMGCRRVDEEIQQQMEQKALLADALAKANMAISSKNTFLSNMSHDLRTPLHAIFGFTSLAKLNLGNTEEATDYLNRVEAASRQMLDMIDKVLEISALADQPELKESECALDQVAGTVYQSILPLAQEKDVTLVLDCSGVRHKAVFADRDRLRQLLTYLTTNAVTYNRPGGRVDLSVDEVEDLPNHYAMYRFTVKDTGVGMSPEFVSHIFEPFSRERNSTLSGVHGLGLGLTIVKNILDLMGGSITIDSAVDQGSTFTATLTLRYQPEVEPPRRAAEKKGGGKRILLAEDNEINREIEVELLERMGFTIESVENGKKVLERLEAVGPGVFDLVLMDLQMPVMDGWEAAETIRALPDPGLSKIPIVALSANVLESDQQRSKECGIDAHLLKPMDLSLLLKTIREITEKPRDF